MVPKPTPGEWRFTLDFVRLNDCTSDLEGWPITLIRPLFQRLGTRKPKYFAKLDLTAGYHQARLDEAPCVYTAFRTIHGLYEWTRVPMGTKGSVWHHSTHCTTVRTILSHSHVPYILYITCFPTFPCWGYIFNIDCSPLTLRIYSSVHITFLSSD